MYRRNNRLVQTCLYVVFHYRRLVQTGSLSAVDESWRKEQIVETSHDGDRGRFGLVMTGIADASDWLWRGFQTLQTGHDGDPRRFGLVMSPVFLNFLLAWELSMKNFKKLLCSLEICLTKCQCRSEVVVFIRYYHWFSSHNLTWTTNLLQNYFRSCWSIVSKDLWTRTYDFDHMQMSFYHVY